MRTHKLTLIHNGEYEIELSESDWAALLQTVYTAFGRVWGASNDPEALHSWQDEIHLDNNDYIIVEVENVEGGPA